jgi:hypothetical protein
LSGGDGVKWPNLQAFISSHWPFWSLIGRGKGGSIPMAMAPNTIFLAKIGCGNPSLCMDNWIRPTTTRKSGEKDGITCGKGLEQIQWGGGRLFCFPQCLAPILDGWSKGKGRKGRLVEFRHRSPLLRTIQLGGNVVHPKFLGPSAQNVAPHWVKFWVGKDVELEEEMSSAFSAVAIASLDPAHNVLCCFRRKLATNVGCGNGLEAFGAHQRMDGRGEKRASCGSKTGLPCWMGFGRKGKLEGNGEGEMAAAHFQMFNCVGRNDRNKKREKTTKKYNKNK